MKVWGMTPDDITSTLDIATKGRVEPYNMRQDGRAVALRLVPHNARAPFARRSASGRRMRALCYHGFRDAILALFNVGGTSRIQSVAGDWRTVEAFRNDLGRLREHNVGSQADPAYMWELCDCEEDDL